MKAIGSAHERASMNPADRPTDHDAALRPTAPRPAEDPAPAGANVALVDAFCDQLWLRDGLAPASIGSYRRDLAGWSKWLRGRNLLAADRGDVEAWLADQFGARAKASSVARRLSTLRRFYRLQLEHAAVREDPTLRVASPKRARHLPKLLSEAQVEALLGAPDPAQPLGLRDRAMLETLYPWCAAQRAWRVGWR
jgi:integrase/recombinase XerD